MLLFESMHSFLIMLLINPHYVESTEQTNLDHLKKEDHNVYRIGACTSKCLKQFPQQHQLEEHQQLESEQHVVRTPFDICFLDCKNANTISPTELHIIEDIRKIPDNSTFYLICRDEKSLTFRIDFDDNAATANNTKATTSMNEKQAETVISASLPSSVMLAQTAQDQLAETLFIIKVYEANVAMVYDVYMSNEKFFTIEHLQPNTTYNISVVAMHANNEYTIIDKEQQYTTLQTGYTPTMVKNVQVRRFHPDKTNENRANAIITWTPSSDMICTYNIICYTPEGEELDLVTTHDISNRRQLYSYQVEDLIFSTDYKVGVRATNPSNMTNESEIFWQTFTTPSCVDLYSYNFSVCAPPQPSCLEVDQIAYGNNAYALNITWRVPKHLPDYYRVRVVDLSTNGILSIVNLAKELHSFYINKIILKGMLFEVEVTAFTNGGSSSAVLTIWTTQNSWDKTVGSDHPILMDNDVKIMFASLGFLIFVFILTCVCVKIYMYCQTMLEKECHNLNNSLPVLASAAPPAENVTQVQLNVDVEEEDVFIDPMEINRNDLTLHEVLGEGAFGLVRRGIFRDEKLGLRQVAVKMLKEQPSQEDVNAFRREIEVMKSVDKHTNIVGIIGSYTKHQHEMLLLTEYCSLGNLLDFLKDEWYFIQEQQEQEYSRNNCNQMKTTAMCIKASAPKRKTSTTSTTSTTSDISSSTKSTVIAMDGETGETGETDGYSRVFFDEYADDDDDVFGDQQEHQQKEQTILAVDNICYFEANTNTTVVDEADNDFLLPREPMTIENMLDIARQVAVGMEFLARNKVVHRDLAARNVLLTSDRTVKIADFGLSRDIYQESIYKKIGDGKLPVKWMALESITHQVYTTQSDVWSYGILLYEIITLGGSPYPTVPTNCLVNFLKEGNRMEKPEHCDQKLYDLMYSCWNKHPSERPNFTEIIMQLDKLRTELIMLEEDVFVDCMNKESLPRLSI